MDSALGSREPRWGDRRIQGELLKLSYRVSATTIRGVLRRHRVPPAPRRGRPNLGPIPQCPRNGNSGLRFLHRRHSSASDLYVLVFLEISSRRILYANCTAHPNSAWVTQQSRNLTWG